MPKEPFLTAPIKTDKMPPGVPYIVGNEAAERFSYYGLRAILIVYMTQYLVNREGQLAPLSDSKATEIYHHFMSAVYFLPLLGAIISDIWWGKYKTIMVLSLVYCLGPLALALDHTALGLYTGLALIAIGSGGIKPCVSAHVGDQFGASNQHLLTKVFGWFYFSINFGSFFSTLITPVLLKNPKFGPTWAFGVPAVLMFIATWVFWQGRHKFVHIPAGGKAFFTEAFNKAGLKQVGKLLPIFAFMPIFWSLYDQSSSRWILQAKEMDRNVFGYDILPAQTHAANPILVLLFIPLFTKILYPAMDRAWKLTPLRKVGIGFFLTVASFLVPAWIEVLIGRGERPHIYWQLIAYILLTAGEVMVYLTMLEFAYTQAPKRLKSIIMSLSLLCISLGNELTALINRAIRVFAWENVMTGPTYYLFFSGLMFVAAIGFIFVAMRYKEQTILHDEAAA
ncbi:MAG: POT family MFS transporter [Limisphaerales bacterium]